MSKEISKELIRQIEIISMVLEKRNFYSEDELSDIFSENCIIHYGSPEWDTMRHFIPVIAVAAPEVAPCTYRFDKNLELAAIITHDRNLQLFRYPF